MSNIRKVNYDCAEKALEGLKKDPTNKTYYDLAESMAEKEAFNIKNWEIEAEELGSQWHAINARISKGVEFLDNYQYVISPKYFNLCLKKFNTLLSDREKLESRYKEISEYLNLFTSYKAYSNNFANQPKLELAA